MANKKISQLPTHSGTVPDSAYVVVNVGSTTSKALVSQLPSSSASSPFEGHTGNIWDGTEQRRVANANLSLSLTTNNKQTGVYKFIQDATGGRTLTINGVAIPVASGPGDITYVSGYRDEITNSYDLLYATNIAGNAGSGGNSLIKLNNLSASAQATSSTLTISWADIQNESSYLAEIATNSSFTTGLQSQSKAAGSTSHQFTGLVADTLYYWRVKGVGDGQIYSDGNFATGSIQTAAQGQSDVTPPTRSSVIIENSAPSVIKITYNETLANVTIPASDFVLSGQFQTSPASVSVVGSTVLLQFAGPFSAGASFTLSYTSSDATNRIKDSAGNAAANFSGVAVTNNVEAVASGDFDRATPFINQLTNVESVSVPTNHQNAFTAFDTALNNAGFLKSDFYAMYLFYTTTVNGQRYNYLDPRNVDDAYFLTLAGNTGANDIYGFTSNGDSYADTKLNPSTVMVPNNVGYTFKLKGTNATNGIGFGVFSSPISGVTPNLASVLNFDGANSGFTLGSDDNAIVILNSAIAFNQVFTAVRRANNDAKVFANGVSKGTSTTVSAQSNLPNGNMYVLARNNGAGVTSFQTLSNTMEFVAIHKGAPFTDAKAAAFATAVNNLMTSLGR